MKMKLIKAEDFGLEPAKVATIEQAFAPVIIERDALIQSYEAIVTKELNPYFNGSITTAATMGRKLTKENDVEIFKLREKGETLASIAKKYNVSPQAISSILKKTKNI